MVKSSGWPSKGADGRGSAKLNAPAPPVAPACAHAPVSPATTRHAEAASTPADPVMVAPTVSGAGPSPKNSRPVGSVKSGAVRIAMPEICGASGAITHTWLEGSQALPAAQSVSCEQPPRLDVRHAASATQAMRIVARMNQNAKVRTAPAASSTAEAANRALAVCALELPDESRLASPLRYTP